MRITFDTQVKTALNAFGLPCQVVFSSCIRRANSVSCRPAATNQYAFCRFRFLKKSVETAPFQKTIYTLNSLYPLSKPPCFKNNTNCVHSLLVLFFFERMSNRLILHFNGAKSKTWHCWTKVYIAASVLDDWSVSIATICIKIKDVASYVQLEVLLCSKQLSPQFILHSTQLVMTYAGVMR